LESSESASYHDSRFNRIFVRIQAGYCELPDISSRRSDNVPVLLGINQYGNGRDFAERLSYEEGIYPKIHFPDIQGYVLLCKLRILACGSVYRNALHGNTGKLVYSFTSLPDNMRILILGGHRTYSFGLRRLFQRPFAPLRSVYHNVYVSHIKMVGIPNLYLNLKQRDVLREFCQKNCQNISFLMVKELT
jgi:hypothetical protein